MLKVNVMFVKEGDTYMPQVLTDSGWPVPTLHGGPVAALLAHEIGRHRGDAAFQPARLTVDLPRPVPRAPLSLRSNVVREGRRLKLVDAELLDGEKVVARASGLFLRAEEGNTERGATIGTKAVVPPPETAPRRHWVKGSPPETPIFHWEVEVRRVSEWHLDEPMVAWIRVPQALLPGVPLTPFERLATCSDFTNVMGSLTQRDEALTFINADITMSLVREPVGEWLCLEIAARAHHHGVGVSMAHFHDTEGFVGHVVVNCLQNAYPDRLRAGPRA